MARKNTSRITLTESVCSTPMTQTEWEAAEDLLARMVARAIAADHPKSFGRGESGRVTEMKHGPTQRAEERCENG